MSKRGIILMGGGLDSTALLIWLRLRELGPDHDLIAMHFNYGQKAFAQERAAVAYFCDKYHVPLTGLDVPINRIATSDILEGPQSLSGRNVIEGRNAIFVMLAATYAATRGADRIYLGYHEEPPDAPFPDATMRAVQGMQAAIDTCYLHPIQIRAPFSLMPRQEVVSLGHRLDSELLTKSHTCYEGVDGGCGRCVHCQQRQVMLDNLRTGKNNPLPRNE